MPELQTAADVIHLRRFHSNSADFLRRLALAIEQDDLPTAARMALLLNRALNGTTADIDRGE